MRGALTVRLIILAVAVAIGVISLTLHMPQILFIIATLGALFYTGLLLAKSAPLSYVLYGVGAFAFLTYGTLGSLGIFRAHDWLAAIALGVMLLLGALYADQSQYMRFKEAFKEVSRRRDERLMK